MASAFEGDLYQTSSLESWPEVSDIVKTARILLVEDDELLGMILSETLDEMGYRVSAIAAGENEAVAAAARYRPDMMIVDVNLAEGSGVKAVERILLTGFVPHVFMSGDVSSLRLLKPGAIILRKPFTNIDLDRAIHRALETASS